MVSRSTISFCVVAPGAAQQVDGAARVLRESGYNIDTVYTSILKRSVRTAWLLLKELGRLGEALPLMGQCLAGAKIKYGAQERQTLACMPNLSLIHI